MDAFQRAYNDAYAYGALRVGLRYGVKSGLLVASFLYVPDHCCILCQLHMFLHAFICKYYGMI